MAVVINILLFVLFLVAKSTWDWDVSLGPIGAPLFFFFWGVGLTFLFIASQLFVGLIDLRRHLSPTPTTLDVHEPALFSSLRKYPYYLGFFFDLAAIAVAVEETGGLVRSPFTAVLLAMILAAQQLGRYRSNSMLFGIIGLALIGILVLFEWLNGVRMVTAPPDQLVFSILVAAFGVAAAFNHFEKPPNFRAMVKQPLPTNVVVYPDSDQLWRVLLFVDAHPIDIPLADCPRSAPPASAMTALEGFVHKSFPALEIAWDPSGTVDGRHFARLRVPPPPDPAPVPATAAPSAAPPPVSPAPAPAPDWPPPAARG